MKAYQKPQLEVLQIVPLEVVRALRTAAVLRRLNEGVGSDPDATENSASDHNGESGCDHQLAESVNGPAVTPGS